MEIWNTTQKESEISAGPENGQTEGFGGENNQSEGMQQSQLCRSTRIGWPPECMALL